MASSPTSAPPPSPGPRAMPRTPESPGGGILARGWVVRTVIAITLLLTIGMVALIYYGWLTVQEPTATIVVSGDESLDGAQIILTPSPAGPVVPVLNSDDDFSTPIHLQPGDYHLTVKLEDQIILDTDITADRLRTPDIILPTLLSVVGEPIDDGADASLTRADGTSFGRQELDRDSDYTAKWWVGQGTYQITVVRHGITLYYQSQVILPHRPVSIDLSQPRHGRD